MCKQWTHPRLSHGHRFHLKGFSGYQQCELSHSQAVPVALLANYWKQGSALPQQDTFQEAGCSLAHQVAGGTPWPPGLPSLWVSVSLSIKQGLCCPTKTFPTFENLGHLAWRKQFYPWQWPPQQWVFCKLMEGRSGAQEKTWCSWWRHGVIQTWWTAERWQ